MEKVEKYEKLNKPGLWFVCSGQPATELWVRDFNIELHAEIDYHTYKSDEFGDDLDWNKCDYFD